MFTFICIVIAFFLGFIMADGFTANKANKRVADVVKLFSYIQQVNTAVNHWQVYNAAPIRKGDKEKALSSAYQAIDSYASVSQLSFNGKKDELQLCANILHAATLLISADLEESPEYTQQAIKLIEAADKQYAAAKKKPALWIALNIVTRLKWVHMMAFAVRYHQSPASTMSKADAVKALKSFATPAEIEALDPENDRLLGSIYKMANS